jgi:hypothetical protein
MLPYYFYSGQSSVFHVSLAYYTLVAIWFLVSYDGHSPWFLQDVIHLLSSNGFIDCVQTSVEA